MHLPYGSSSPRIHPLAYVAPNATLVGDVEVGEEASVWFGAVLRADGNRIVVGDRSNVQDGVMAHADPPDAGGNPVQIGADVTVGHGVILHGCRIGDRSLIGMGSVLLEGVQVGEDAFVAAGALLPEGTVVPDGTFVVGAPAAFRRPVGDRERALQAQAAQTYRDYAVRYRAQRDASSG